jgi:undecaprenyl-diphosphatase
MTHGGEFLLGPSWDSGLDSFPSGHAGASFAVATVLAKHFPRTGWVWYGAACWVAASRVLRGSHFPTDVFTGAGLGILAGYVAANPMRVWRASLGQGLIEMVPYLVALFALLWTAVHPYPDGWMNPVMVGLGVTMVGIGMGFRWYAAFSEQPSAFRVWVFPLLAVGLALTTGSALVTAVAGLVSVGRWAQPVHDPPIGSAPAASRNRVVFAEVALAVWLILVIVVVQGLKGLLPIL